MITLLVEEYNPLTPNFYNDLILNLQFHQLTCPCGHSGCLSIHGYYNRFIKTACGKQLFRICRVICECCSHTHALLLSSMVPYSQVALDDQLAVVSNYESRSTQDSVMNSNPYIDESCYRYIIRSYRKHWKERLLSESIYFNSDSSFIQSCFSFFNRQFMQIKTTYNILFLNTT